MRVRDYYLKYEGYNITGICEVDPPDPETGHQLEVVILTVHADSVNDLYQIIDKGLIEDWENELAEQYEAEFEDARYY